MPSLNKYTFTNIQYTIPEGTNVSGLYPTAQITIVPYSGYTVNAADFSLDPIFSDGAVQSVVFTQDGLNVLCTVTFDTGFVMPSNNYTIPLCVVGEGKVGEITIGGTISADVGPNITGDISETNTPYSNSGLVGETELLLTRSYTAAPGYYLTSTGLQVVEGNASNYNIVQGPTYDVDGNLTGISYAVNYTYPNQSIAGDRLSIFQVSAKEIYVAPQYVTSYGPYRSTIPFSGINFDLSVYGGEGAVFSAELAYDATTTPIVTNATLPETGVLSIPISIPANYSGSFTPRLYTITFSGDIDPAFSQPNPITITQYGILPRINFTGTSTQGVTGFNNEEIKVPLLTTFTKKGGPYSDPPSVINLTRILTSPSGTYLDINNGFIESNLSNTRSTEIEVSGDYTNASSIDIINTTTDRVLNVGDQFNLSYLQDQDGYAPYKYTITAINGPQYNSPDTTTTNISISPNITVADGTEISAWSNNGNLIAFDNENFEIERLADNSVKVTFVYDLLRTGVADTTFNWNLDEVFKAIPVAACDDIVPNGGEGITDTVIQLDPAGGIVCFLVDPVGVPDKFELTHGLPNLNNKVATSGMNTSGNNGPFDNIYGTEATNTIPTEAQATSTLQFIGTDKEGTIDTRQTEFHNATGETIATMQPGGVGTVYKQVLWWEYTSIDYNANPIATLRVTGPTGTAWTALRVCFP
jgi:hypothetical protein